MASARAIFFLEPYINKKRSPVSKGERSLGGCQPQGLRVLLIPFLAAHAPIPLFHGLCAARFVLLREEGLLVGRDLREVMTALLDHRCHADKAVADLVLTLRQR